MNIFLVFILIDLTKSIQIEQFPSIFQVKENSPNGTLIGSIVTFPSNYQLTLINDGNGRFRLNSFGQLLINDQSRLNYEYENQHEIQIRFFNQSNIFEKTFLINIEDVNESPMNLQCSHQSGFCTAIDEDFNQTLTFEIKSFNSSHNEIQCTDNGQPSLSVSLWFNILPDGLSLLCIPGYSLRIPVNNNNSRNIVGFNSNEKHRTDKQRYRRQANSPPQDIYFNMFYLNIPENSRDFQIAHVYVIDEDNDNYTCSMYTYGLEDNQQPFEIHDEILQTSLTMHNNNYDLDFETIEIYNISVTCVDPIHHLTITKNFSINVDDLNEAPVELTLIPDVLPENSPSGYVLGQLFSIDHDRYPVNQTFDYSIVTDSNRLFRLENDRLILIRENQVDKCLSQPDLCPHDYEQRSSLYIRIQVEDHGQPRASQKFWIQIRITNENDPPVNLQLNTNLVKENSPIGFLIGSFTIQDQDFYQTHTFELIQEAPLSLNGNLFLIEDNQLRLARIPDYEQEQFLLITVRAIDNGTIPMNITRDFLIEIVDVDEFPKTFMFLPSTDETFPSRFINDLIEGKQPVRTIYLPQSAYLESSLGRIIFLMEDRDRDLDLTGFQLINNNELTFSKPSCELISDIPYRSLCTSIVTVNNPNLVYDNNDGDGHVLISSLTLTSDGNNITFPRPLRIKFENITLTIDDKPMETIDIPKDGPIGYEIGRIHAIDLAAGGLPVESVMLNPNSSLSYPLELINSTLLKVRDDVNLSSFDLPTFFNVSMLVTISGEENRILEKYLTIYLKDKRDFNLTLSNNKIIENCHEDVFIGDLMLEDGFGNYTIGLIDDANGRFKLNGFNLLTARRYLPHCHLNRSCPLDHENEPRINITVAIRHSFTNETLRQENFSIEILDENEAPYNLTLSTQSIAENATIGSLVGLLNGMDDDFNQTLIYSTDSSQFTIDNNQLILQTNLDADHQPIIPVTIRANDNGQPSTFTEKTFLINVIPVNKPPINVTSNPMTVYYPSNSSSIMAGQINIIDPDVKENFTITFNHPNYRALPSVSNPFSIISDDGYVLYAQIYNIGIEDFNPPVQSNQLDYYVNITANITDSAGHSILHNFTVRYLPQPTMNSSFTSTISPSTTPSASNSQALHIHIYETTPPNIPIIRGLIHSLNNSLPICFARDEQMFSFPINTTDTAFIISLPENYTLNSTIHPRILLNVQCHITNNTNVDQDIVIDVLPAPPTLQINFNQTQPFYAITNNHSIQGTFSLNELTTTPTNRTYNLALVNYQDTFQLLPNNSLLQIGPYPLDLFENANPYINLTVQAIETTPNQPTRLIQNTFTIPILLNTSTPYLSFSRSSLPNDTNLNTIIGNLTAHNTSTLSRYHLYLLENYDNGLEFDVNTHGIILKRPVHTLPLINNQTQLLIKTALMNESNQTILTATFPLTITYPNGMDQCLNRDCGNGICIQSNESFAYCLCTSGYQGINCREIDSCAYNPCANNGLCQQLTTTGDFICQCLPNYSDTLCQTFVDLCQVNRSLCSEMDICIPKTDADLFICISRDELKYFVFDYLNQWKNIDVINDRNLPEQLKDFFERNFFPIENLVLPERKILGPIKYNRAQLLSVVLPSINDTLQIFCFNQSSIIDSFARDICNGYQRAIDLDQYFRLTPTFCPNCTFADAADKYYWFDKVIPFLPFWITLIVGSLLMTIIPLFSLGSNAPKKVAVPLMKTRIGLGDEFESDLPILTKSVRSAVKYSRKSSRERTDSGYESNEENENYLEQIINNHQNESTIHVYPLLHNSRSSNVEHHGATIDDLIFSKKSPDRRYHTQRSASMLTDKSRRPSSTRNSQTLKPIIQRRSTLFDSNSNSVMHLGNSSRTNDQTYVSSTFRNENTSKFVIGTLWNTFALVNNLFLHRPQTRRNAMTGENIQAEQLAHLEHLYSLAEHNQQDQLLTHDTLSEPQTNHLQSIVLDILSSNRNSRRCTCYGNHHLPSCIYYDHSLPYIRRYLDNTSELERIFYDIRRTNQRAVRDASTQSYLDKPTRTFMHSRSTVNTATQYSPMNNPLTHPNYMNISTQTSNNLNEHSKPIEYTNILPRMKSKDHTYINASPLFTSTENEDVSTQHSAEEILPRITTDSSTQYHTKPFVDDQMYDRRNSLMNELKEVISSSNIKQRTTKQEDEDDHLHPNHTVRSLVSMFETTSPFLKQSHSIFPDKSLNNHSKVLTPPNISSLNITVEEIHNPIEQYADEVASNIVDHAVLTATTTAIHHNEQLQRRFSSYRNGGGHGKSLLFQSNTFVPSNDIDSNLRAESQTSSALLNDRVPTEDPPQHTLIVGRHVTGREARRRRKCRSLNNLDKTYDIEYSSSSSLSSNADEKVIDHRQFLSNSQLLSAQEIYIRPWLIRRATAPDIHCLDHYITDTRVEQFDRSETYFSIFPKNNNPRDLYTRLTCLITILFFLRNIEDDNDNRILYDEINRIHQRLITPRTTPFPSIHSNTFRTINPDGSKRYRTGILLDINSTKENLRRKILAQQIEWKCVKVLVRRFRKKYRYYKQLMKTDSKNSSKHFHIEHYLNLFDSTSKRRIKKYAKHYAEKL